MNKILLIIAISFLLLPALKADNAELEKLQAENKAAIQKVMDRYESNLKIIDRAFLKKLMELKKYFIKKGDLNGAVAVRDEINAFKEKVDLSDKEEKEPPKVEKVEDTTTDDNTNTSTEPEDGGDDEDTDNDDGNGDDNGNDNKVHGEEEF